MRLFQGTLVDNYNSYNNIAMCCPNMNCLKHNLPFSARIRHTQEYAGVQPFSTERSTFPSHQNLREKYNFNMFRQCQLSSSVYCLQSEVKLLSRS